jgi:hypothetical protein
VRSFSSLSLLFLTACIVSRRQRTCARSTSPSSMHLRRRVPLQNIPKYKSLRRCLRHTAASLFSPQSVQQLLQTTTIPTTTIQARRPPNRSPSIPGSVRAPNATKKGAPGAHACALNPLSGSRMREATSSQGARDAVGTTVQDVPAYAANPRIWLSTGDMRASARNAVYLLHRNYIYLQASRCTREIKHINNRSSRKCGELI